MSYIIRAVEQRDIEGILAILIPQVQYHTNNFDWDAPTLADVQTKWEKGTAKYPWLAAIITDADGNEVVAGYAMAGAFRDKQSYTWTVESTVYIHPHHLRKGIAKGLYNLLLTKLRVQGIFTVIACITMGNDASIILHEQLGFVASGMIPKAGFKFGRWLDIGFWTLELQEEGVLPNQLIYYK